MFLEATNVLMAATDAMVCSDMAANRGGYIWVWMTVVPIGFYSALSVVTNAVDCYNFVVAWNMITRTHRMDLELLHFQKNVAVQRRIALKKALVTRPYRDIFFPKEVSCPICLADFQRSDQVSSCCDRNDHRSKLRNSPCCHMFHEECLTAWLQNHSNCPCCRHEMLPLPQELRRSPVLVPVSSRE